MLSYFCIETGVAVTVNLAPFAEYNALSIATQLLICSNVANFISKLKNSFYSSFSSFISIYFKKLADIFNTVWPFYLPCSAAAALDARILL